MIIHSIDTFCNIDDNDRVMSSFDREKEFSFILCSYLNQAFTQLHARMCVQTQQFRFHSKILS